MEKVLQSSREASTAVGKNYGQRPASYKGSLSLKMDRFTVRRESPSPDRGRGDKDWRRTRDREHSSDGHRDEITATSSYVSSNISQEQQDRLKKLREKYGDAATKS